MDASVLFGFLKVIGIALAPVLIVTAFVRADSLFRGSVTLARRLHLLRPPPLRPDGPPLEVLAATLRRLRPRVQTPQPGVAVARQRGIDAAYDEALVHTARALEVPTSLADLPEGYDRAAERLCLEHALEQAGFDWHTLGA